jgi:hypothetical protein
MALSASARFRGIDYGLTAEDAVQEAFATWQSSISSRYLFLTAALTDSLTSLQTDVECAVECTVFC